MKRAVRKEDQDKDYSAVLKAKEAGDEYLLIEYREKYRNTTTYTGIHSQNDIDLCVTGWCGLGEPDCDWFCRCDDRASLLGAKENAENQLKKAKHSLGLIDKYMKGS